jgi:hypothetical protein
MPNLELPAGAGRPRRVVLLADETVVGGALRAVGERHGRSRVDMLVVVPAFAGRLALSTSDDAPRRAAERRLHRCLAALRARGIRAEGLVGDADPLLALEDALCLFPADEILVVTAPSEGGHGDRLVTEARLRHGRSVEPVVVETGEARAA